MRSPYRQTVTCIRLGVLSVMVGGTPFSAAAQGLTPLPATIVKAGAVGSHEGLGKNQYGPAGAEVTAMRFRIRTAGEGIELLPIGGPPVK